MRSDLLLWTSFPGKLTNISEGEHITDASGHLSYIPFPTCLETKRPLEFFFGIEQAINCTIDINDEFYHTLEFYVHFDTPFTCRIPARPLGLERDDQGTEEDPLYVPLIMAITGQLQLSHLHVSRHLNVLMHAVPKSIEQGVVNAATAYSAPLIREQEEQRDPNPLARIIPGETLPLMFTVRWYPNTVLPSGWTGVGGHIFASTLVYCLLCAGAATAICIAYFRGVDIPRRLRSHGKNRVGGVEGGGAGRLGGYGYGIGTAGFTGQGKRD